MNKMENILDDYFSINFKIDGRICYAINKKWYDIFKNFFK